MQAPKWGALCAGPEPCRAREGSVSPTLASHGRGACKSVLWCGSAAGPMGCQTHTLGMSPLSGGAMVSLSPQPENILCVAATGHMVKIIDFGLARRCHLPPALAPSLLPVSLPPFGPMSP